MNENETVRDVCTRIYMRSYAYMVKISEVDGWRERILAAYEREMEAKDAEIALLKAALKPVMECHEEACRAFGDHYLMLDNAVREAQRIMKEGEAK